MRTSHYFRQKPTISNPTLSMKIVSWAKDSHGLFDYESSQLHMKKFDSEGSCVIYKKENEIFIEDKPIDEKDSSMIGCVAPMKSKNPSSVYFQPFSQEEIFLIVRSLKNKEGNQRGFEMKIGDVYKLGLVEMKVVEMKFSDTKHYSQLEIGQSLEVKTSPRKIGTKTCRICLGEETDTTIKNKFVSICYCKGSCEYVHVGCLKQWLSSKVKKKMSGASVHFKMKNMECELCKHPLPLKIKVDGSQVDLIDISRPDCPFIIFECKSHKKGDMGLFLVHFFTEEVIKVGRGHGNDIRVSDISLSRHHASLMFEKEKFMIFDNNSKFGTLALVKEPLEIDEDKVAVQIGKTVISLFYKPQSKGNALQRSLTKINKNSENFRVRQVNGLSRKDNKRNTVNNPYMTRTYFNNN